MVSRPMCALRNWSLAASLIALTVTIGPLVSVSAAGSLPSWSEYFPSRSDIGRTCSLTLLPESASGATNTVTTTGTQEETLIAIKSVRAGEEYTFRLNVVSHQTNSPPVVPASMSSTSHAQTLKYTEVLTYLVLANGTVEAPMEKEESVPSTFGVKGHLYFPSMSDIAKGTSTRGQLDFWFTSSTPSGLASIEAATKGHAKSVKGSFVEQVSGIMRPVIETHSQTFQNVVGLRETASQFRVSNALTPAVATALEETMRDVVQSNTTTFWYAPHRGMVSRWNVSSAGVRTESDTKCAPK